MLELSEGTAQEQTVDCTLTSGCMHGKRTIKAPRLTHILWHIHQSWEN